METHEMQNLVRHTGLFSALFFFSCLLLFSCNNNKPATKANADQIVPRDLITGGETATGIIRPCHWSFTIEQETTGEAILISTAKIDPGWHLYSQHISEKGSPTVFTYDASPGYALVGATEEEGTLQKGHDPYLKIDLLYFEKQAVFRQKIKVLSKKDFTITGTINHTACLKQCVTNDEDFSFHVRGNPGGR
jgi:hypothetical protein